MIRATAKMPSVASTSQNYTPQNPRAIVAHFRNQLSTLRTRPSSHARCRYLCAVVQDLKAIGATFETKQTIRVQTPIGRIALKAARCCSQDDFRAYVSWFQEKVKKVIPQRIGSSQDESYYFRIPR